MTVEEKRLAIRNHCYDFNNCNKCPLNELDEEHCYAKELTDEIIERNYSLIFDKNPIKPDYYNDTKIAPIDVIEDWELDFCLGSALKYIKRAGKKDNNPSVQDLKKVIWYVERRIKELEEVNHD